MAILCTLLTYLLFGWPGVGARCGCLLSGELIRDQIKPGSIIIVGVVWAGRKSLLLNRIYNVIASSSLLSYMYMYLYKCRWLYGRARDLHVHLHKTFKHVHVQYI